MNKSLSYKNAFSADRVCHIDVAGSIGDDFQISLVDIGQYDSVEIDMTSAMIMNSAGTRLFTKWLWEIEATMPNLPINIFNVSPAVNRALVSVKAYVASNLKMRSVFVPYSCKECDFYDSTVLVTDTEIGSTADLGRFTSQTRTCPKCGQQMIFDGFATKYFALLTRSI